ncbi:MAG: hypothetical protein ACPHKZ_00815 [Candidatus Thalassarchaeaceae archaeon]
MGATAAFLVSISLKAMRIIALAQAAFLGFLAISGIITINFGRLLEIITDIVSWLANSLESIFSSILELGSFGAGFAGGFIGTTVLLEALNDDA